MKIVGIIAEFNPFHNGHKYLISKAKKVCNADAAVIVCSGNYVQRGMPAIINKTSRCEMAMLKGADLVIELPVVYSTASAELFATASIALLDSLNCVDYLCFGCETDSIDLLNTVAEILINEPKEYKDLLNRLSRIEGQVRGIRRMVENDAYCPDILVQVSAVNAALNSFNKVLLANHIRTCVADDIREGKDATVDELVATLQKLMK